MLNIRRARLRAFTLIELVVVVAVIGILAALAVPSLARRMRDATAQRAAVAIVDLFRVARTRAMGRGAAVLVTWDGAAKQFQVLEAVRGQLSASGAEPADCYELPDPHCTPNTRWDSDLADPTGGTRLIRTVALEGAGASDTEARARVWLRTASASGGGGSTASEQAINAVSFCFSPSGRAYLATGLPGTLGAMQEMEGPARFDVYRDAGSGSAAGLTRRVYVLPNGMAKLGAAQ